ncbi:hypothetical protein CRM22_005847 [Opisthorchis felineus]|uniref:Uncharacterized protein n=1 Tax=Opisthorchis felineus TaxID=147828 RepID=A0A4S2LQL5_OPIFE|nr:hypothetical protein CRM22_005847 [Opisthorchis felineus]
MTGTYEVIECLEVANDDQPIEVHGISETRVHLFSFDRSLLLCNQDYSVTSSLTHNTVVTGIAITPDGSVILFTDQKGALNIYLPTEDDRTFSLSTFGIVRTVRILPLSEDKFDLLLLTDQLLHWTSLDLTTFKSALTKNDTEAFNLLIQKAVRYPASSFSCFAATYHLDHTWTLQLSEQATLYASDAAGLIQQTHLFNLTGSKQPSFLKACLISPVYCIALSNTNQLHLFNVAASLCLGALFQFPAILDFCVGGSLSDSSEYCTAEYPGISPFKLVVLRQPCENDPPPKATMNFTCNFIEVMVFPSAVVLHRAYVHEISWLLTVSVCTTDAMRSDGVYFAELSPNAVNDGESKSRLTLKMLQTLDPRQRIARLLKEDRFAEAREVMKAFDLDSTVGQTIALAELRFRVTAVITQRKTCDIVADDANQLLLCLNEVQKEQLDENLLSQLSELGLPTAELQMRLLLLLKGKLCSVPQKTAPPESCLTKVFTSLKRIKTFLLLYGPHRYSVTVWERFCAVDAYVLFIQLLMNQDEFDNSCRNSVLRDPGKAFLVWDLFKEELLPLLNSENLERLCNFLTQRPLSYNSGEAPTDRKFVRDFVAAEAAIHRWLRNELLYAVVLRCSDALPVLVQFVIKRVYQLEAFRVNSSTGTGSHNLCPFVWPSDALGWTEDFIEAASFKSEDAPLRTPGDEVCWFLSGLASLDPEVDPLSSLRKLDKQLRTLEILQTRYNLKLTLDCCDEETELSIGYRILDLAFKSGMPSSHYVDTVTSRYLTDRAIDHDAFFLGYTLDLVGRIKKIAHLPDTTDSLNDNNDRTEFTRFQPADCLHSEDLNTLIHQACLASGWISTFLCKLEAVSKLASVVRLPWPPELLDTVDHLLSCATEKRLLSNGSEQRVGFTVLRVLSRLKRLGRIAKVHSILQRHKINGLYLGDAFNDDSVEFGKRAIYRMLANPIQRESLPDPEVLKDARVIARELIESPDWELWFARIRMEIAFETTISMLTESAPPTSSRECCLSFIFAQLDSIVADFGGCSEPLHLRAYLIRICLRSVDIALQARNCMLPEQCSLLEDLGISLSICLNAICPADTLHLKSVRLYRWLHNEHTSSMPTNLHQLNVSRSLNGLTNACLRERCVLVRQLTSWFAEAHGELWDSSCAPLSLVEFYDLVFSDLPPVLRGELLAWNWYSSVLVHLKSNPNQMSLGAGDKLKRFRSILTTLRETVSHYNRLHSVAEGGSAKLRKLTLVSSFDAPDTCHFCSCLWNSPMARTGALLQLYKDTLIPSILQSMPETHIGSFQSWIFQLQGCIEEMTLLWCWAGAGNQSQPTRKFPTHVGLGCALDLQAGTIQFEGIRQILMAYLAFVNGFTDALQGEQITTSPDSDPLAYRSVVPMFRESVKDTSTSACLESLQLSLQWLVDLCGWLISSPISADEHNYSATEMKSPVDPFEPLFIGAGKVASKWADTFNLPLTASLPLSVGLHRLVTRQFEPNLWSGGQPSIIVTDSMTLGENINHAICSDKASVLRKWHQLRMHWTLSALETALSPAKRSYFDCSFTLCLTLACPIESAIQLVRNLVSSSRHLPKKLMAVASIVYAFAIVSPRRASALLDLSSSMAKSWHWHAALKTYGLDLSHAGHRTEASPFQIVFDKLCRMVPVPSTDKTASCKQMSVLLPADRRAGFLSATSMHSLKLRPLPPLSLLAQFAHDYNLCLRRGLLNHLTSLFMPKAELFCQQSSTDTLFSENVDSGIDTKTYRSCKSMLLSRARLVVKRLLFLCKDTCVDELKTALLRFFTETSSYDYERLRFLMSWISECDPCTLEPQKVKLLHLLESYVRTCGADESERERTTNSLSSQQFTFSNLADRHPMCHVRMPYHLVATHSPPLDVIGSEVNANTVEFWLRVDKLMQWNSANDLRLMAANSLVSQYEKADLLPLAGSAQSTLQKIPAAASWDRSLPCQTLMAPFFSTLRNLLRTVTDQQKVLAFLGGLSRRVLYGPQGLRVVEIACDFAEQWLNKADEEARLEYNNKLSQQQSADRSDLSQELEESGLHTAANERIQWSRDVLERANARYRQLAMEACLHQNHLAHWNEVTQQLQEPAKLITTLLMKVVSVVNEDYKIAASVNSRLPISDLSLRHRLLRTIPRLAEIARIDLLEFSCRLLVDRLRLPAQVLTTGVALGPNDSVSNQSLLLDSSTGAQGIAPCDITFSSTFVGHQTKLVSCSSPSSEQPMEEDYLIAEILLRVPHTRQEFLPSLHSFVFTGDMNAYLVPRWCAARCILRSQLGLVVWPRLSFSELRAVLTRLALLAKWPVSAYQRLLIEASNTKTSQQGGTYTSISVDRLESCVNQLLTVEVNRLLAVEMASILTIDFNLINTQIINQLLFYLREQPAAQSVPHWIRLIDCLRSFTACWKSFAWLWDSSFDTRTVSHLIQQSLALGLGPESHNSKRVGLEFNRSLFTLIGWPFPDENIESALVSAGSQFVNRPITFGNKERYAPYRFGILCHLLVLMSTVCCRAENAHSLRSIFKWFSDRRDQRDMDWLRDALEMTDLHLTYLTFSVSNHFR